MQNLLGSRTRCFCCNVQLETMPFAEETMGPCVLRILIEYLLCIIHEINIFIILELKKQTYLVTCRSHNLLTCKLI